MYILSTDTDGVITSVKYRSKALVTALAYSDDLETVVYVSKDTGANGYEEIARVDASATGITI